MLKVVLFHSVVNVQVTTGEIIELFLASEIFHIPYQFGKMRNFIFLVSLQFEKIALL